MCIGIDSVRNLDCDNYDNGTYIIEGWKIVGREYLREEMSEQMNYDLLEMLIAIDEKQPEKERIGQDVIKTLLNSEEK